MPSFITSSGLARLSSMPVGLTLINLIVLPSNSETLGFEIRIRDVDLVADAVRDDDRARVGLRRGLGAECKQVAPEVGLFCASNFSGRGIHQSVTAVAEKARRDDLAFLQTFAQQRFDRKAHDSVDCPNCCRHRSPRAETIRRAKAPGDLVRSSKQITYRNSVRAETISYTSLQRD